MTELFRDLAEAPESRALNRGLWARRAVMTALVAVCALALADVAGQRGSTSTAAAPGATLKLGLPHAVRGGLLFQAKVEIAAHRDIDHPRLVLGTGWTEGMQVNTIEPGAASEGSRDGHLELSYNKIDAGSSATIWFQFQVDPTEAGRRDFTIELDDARRPVARIARTVTVFP
jgi:hypothetical protein